ncbi:MAG: flagellar basal body P-ring formation chaperone FlgA [Alphaproteobacteria bacterium]|nr:flagellar basal body P-ring formation chaperone FlgA [Alphaproteobacteria bacterium]MCD8570263.1 flagellar basal body P-ring formation chaperone FlgA [Alphaproteobacteria bacterium]
MKLRYKGLPLKVLAFGAIIQMLTIISVFWIIFVVSSQAFAMGLKSNSIVKSDVITLGDLFYDLPRDAEKVLGPAPRPGSEMVLDARTLTKVALALNLPWRPTTAMESVSLRRAATLIEEETVKSVLKKAIADKGMPGKFDLIISGGSGDMILPEDQPGSFDITDLSFDLEKGIFKAALAAPTAQNPIVRNEISGSIEQIVSVPVLKESLNYGAIIRARDIEVVDVPGRQISSKMILDTQNIIGMTPRRTIVAGTPLSDDQLAAPQIIERGKSVIMVYRSGPLVLTAQGKALDNGAKGDVVRVVNVSTNRSLEAIATGEGEVEIRTF